MAKITFKIFGCSACHQSLGSGFFTAAEVTKLRAEHQKNEHKASRKG
jgi:mono/diheme cytochrome c family protein